MKKLLLIIGASVAFVACKKSSDFLDSKVDNNLNETTVFTDSARTMNFLARIYSEATFSFVKGRGAQTEYSTDDAEYSFSSPTNQAVIMYNGSLSPSNTPGDFWSVPYSNIRAINLLLRKLPTTPLSKTLQSRVSGEARFLRAWFYHNLLNAYGGVPMLGDTLFTIDNIPNIARGTYEQGVEYIVKELDEAANLLPRRDDYPEQDYGRITKGACLALKARTLLYAASPLFNGGSPATNDVELKKIMGYETYSAARWQRAADAAKAVMELGDYSLYVDNTDPANPGFGFYRVFLMRVNPEYIFSFNRAGNKDFESFYLPTSRGGARTSSPTHNLAQAFPMLNGKAITEAGSGYDATKPYVGREPRFKYTLIHHGALYFNNAAGAKQAINTSDDGSQDGFSDVATGYYGRKMCDENLAANSPGNTERGWPLIRYAEVLLNYAEAVSEAGNPSLAYPELIKIRTRAGIQPGADGNYGINVNMTPEQLRAFIQNERRIELAFEDQRWNDIRRWKIAEAINNGFNLRIRIKGPAANFTYTVENTLRRHAFREANYLMPIPYVETRKMLALKQNPGY
ncbi:RagB/SusD family nutrient uptake outer membrane protein [uncultured Chitinophaga sp.]|uniref:RagB/SusD family nutrient uptake outer membrane protein n=1 Tax=uncultured Chitinophaga sp. TaxID=339340 RepID=UPI0025E425BB|nr:RagB/SusD family nutrient uptake outer membrane protein [uncultured Chitinophaga sp.]